MKEFQVDGYDTIVSFPDETPDSVVLETIKRDYPEPDELFVNRIADPATPASAVSFDDFKRYQELKPDLSWGDLGNLVVQGAGVAAGELYNGVKSTANLAAQGQLGTMGASVAEGAARGTYDLAGLGKRIQDNVTTMLEPYMQESGDAQKDQYNRFLAIKEMDNVREAARKGDTTILQRFGIGVDPSMVDTESAEGFSYFLDPTVLGTGGSGKLASMLTRAGAKPAELAGRAAGGLARGISAAESKAAELLKSGTAKVDEMTGGLGKYAIPGSVGAAAYGAGLGVTGGAAATAVLAVPALELAEGLFKGFANSMLNNPTRIGPMRHLAMTAPATRAGKAAGYLKWMDSPLDLAAKGTTGAVIGSAYGAGLGGLAGGWEGAAQGFGAGSVLGAGTAGTMRLAEGVTGRAKVRAEENDYNTWRLAQDKDTQDFLDNNIKTHRDRVQVMDAIQLAQAGVGDQATVRVLSGDDFTARFPGADGVQVVEGDVPVAYINGRDGNSRVLFHEIFHSMARLDGFDSLVAGISNEIGKMYSPDEVNALIREYESMGKPLKESEGLVTTGDKFAALAEEIGAEYFANYIKGKDSSYLLKGTPFKDALNSITSKFVAGKLDRVYNTFQSEIFKHTHLKQSKGMDRAMNDLIKARRKAYRDVELSADDAIRAYGERDLGNDQVFKELQALGVAGLDNKGRRVMKTAYAIKKDDTALGKEVSDALSQADPTGGMLKNADGSWVGRNFSPAQIEALLNAPGLSDKVKEVIQFIDTIRKAGSDAANVTYAAATYKTKRGKTRYKNLPISNRDALIYGIEVSPVGTMIARILDLSLLRSKIVRNWAGDSRLQRVFGSQEGMYEDALTYINALGGDIPTATVLGSQEKRNLLNKLLGVRNVKGNPEVPEGLFVKEGDHPWRSFRLDRFVKARALESTQAQFSQQAYEKGQINFSPSEKGPDALRVGTAKLGTKAKPVDTPQDSNIGGGIVGEQALLDHMSKMNYSHVPDRIKSITDPYQKREAYIDWMVDNLLALHDAFPADLREMATKWYDGANLIANTLAEKYQYKPQQVAGVTAVLSPQKDWFMNVAQAEQVIDIWTRHQDTRLDSKWLRAEIEDIIQAAEAPIRQKKKKQPGESKLAATRRKNYNDRLDEQARSDRREKLKGLRGKTIRELDSNPELQGWAIRVLAQVIHGREYRVISPDGKPMQISVKDDGTPQKNGWGAVSEIQKAVSILKDGSLKNISNQLGEKHKVRNFYNNIIAPNSKYGDATIDTHAVAAAHLMPWGASAKAVGHNFGTGVSGAGSPGVSGTYHIYLDAYKKAAEARGLLPRQMQSITWEAIRLLFPPESRKGKANLEKATQKWQTSNDGQARQNIVGGELPPPAWARPGDGGEPVNQPGKLAEDKAKHHAGGNLLFRGGRHVNPQRPKPRKGKRASEGFGTNLPPSRFGVDPAKSGKQFHKSIKQTAKDHPLGPAVEVKDADFYTDTDTALFLSKDKKAGIAVTKNGDLVSVFKHPRSKADIGPLLEEAASISTTLDAFDVQGFLPNLYARYGFRPVARVPWNDAYAPPNWPYDKAGTPDVVLMVRDPKGVLGGEYLDYNVEKESVPVFDDYGDAAKAQSDAKAEIVKAGLGPEVRFSPTRQLNNRGGAVYNSPTGHRAVQTSSRAGVRVYDSAGKRVGPVFQSVEKAQDWLAKRQ